MARKKPATTDSGTVPATEARPGGAPSAGTEEPVSGGSGKGSTLASVILTQLMIVLDMTIIAVALPNMQADLGMSGEQRPWVVTAYTLAFGGLVLFGGRLCGLLGIRRAYQIGLIGFAASSFMAGIAPSFPVLVAGRAIQGAFGGLLGPTNLALLNRAFVEREERGRAFAMLGATGGIGAAIGLLLGGTITEALDWRWSLYVNVAIAAVALAAGRVNLPPAGIRDRSTRFADDLFGLILGCGGIFSMVFGLDQAQSHSWGAPATYGWLVAGTLLILAFVAWERVASNPVLPMWVVASPVRFASYATLFTIGAAQMGTTVYLTFYFQNHFDYSPLRTGVAMLPMVAAIVTTAMLAGRRLVPALGARFMFPLGLAMQAVASFLLSRITVEATYAQVALPGLVVLGIGMGLASPVTYNAGTRGIPEKRAGLASAVLNASQQIGSSFGVAILATYATQHAKDYVAEHAAQLKESTTRALFDAQAMPDSPAGQQIIARMRADFADRAQIEAYAGGFWLLGWIVIGCAIALAIGAVIFVRSQHRAKTRPGQPANGPEERA